MRSTALTASLLVIASLMMPMFALDKPSGQDPQTQRAMAQLERAIKDYQMEYNRYPLSTSESKETPMRSEGRLLKILMAEDRELNPRRFRFYDPPDAKNGAGGHIIDSAGVSRLLDIHGRAFLIVIDYDNDGIIVNPRLDDKAGPRSIHAGVLIWSAGKDGDFNTWQDNITSWEGAAPGR